MIIRKNTAQIRINNIKIHRIGNLYSLRDIHKALYRGNKYKPANWLCTPQAQYFAAFLETARVKTLQTKLWGGVYACEELAIAYATWANPHYSNTVARAFLTQVDDPNGEYQPAKPNEFNCLRYARTWRTEEKYYLVSDISIPYFGMGAPAWVADYCTDEWPDKEPIANYADEMPAFREHRPVWYASHGAMRYMIGKHYLRMPKESRGALIEVFTNAEHAERPVTASDGRSIMLTATPMPPLLARGGLIMPHLCRAMAIHIKNHEGRALADTVAARRAEKRKAASETPTYYCGGTSSLSTPNPYGCTGVGFDITSIGCSSHSSDTSSC